MARPPQVRAPEQTCDCDCHFHIFGPCDEYSLDAGRNASVEGEGDRAAL